MILLIACGIDANDKVVPLAWALVPIENEIWWTWFLRYLKHSIPALSMESHIFISDREKGMAISVPLIFDQSIHMHCCQHIADNLQESCGNKVRPLFWRACRAKTKELFHEKMEELKAQSVPAFDYLYGIPKRTWARAYTTYPRYGHDTSNIVESLNASWSDIRCLPPLQMMDAIYLEAMKTVYNRSTTKQRLQSISDIPIAKFQARMKTSRRYRVFPSGNGIGQVEDPESGRKWIVNLPENECDCTDFYEYQSPCSHAIAAARFSDIDPITLFDNHYSTRVYQKTYCRPLIPVSIENLVPDQNIKPPIIQKQAGRPKTKRIRKGAWQRKQTRCGNCLDWGHNRRRCTGQPASSGRRERAHDWLEEIQGAAEDSEEEDNEVEESENETLLEEEDEQQDEQNKSDSELSQIASSQFDTIEVDQGEEKEIIISYTRSGRIRR
jgi:hypothetical protein